MEQAHFGHIRDNLDQEVIGVFRNTFGVLLESQTRHYIELSDLLLASMEQFLAKLGNDKALANTSQFLFESEDTLNDIYQHLEDKIEENPDPIVQHNFEKFKLDIINLFGLPDPSIQETEPTHEQIPSDLSRWGKISFHLKKWFNKFKLIFRKKREEGNLQSNYILNELAIKPLEENKEKLDTYFRDISGLLMGVWKYSNVISQAVDNLAAADYRLDSFIKPEIEKEQREYLKKLKEDLQRSEKEVLKAIETSINQHTKMINEGSPEPALSPSKFRQLYNTSLTLSSLNKITNKLKGHLHNWHNTMYVLSDDWKIELEISGLKYYILKSGFDFSNYLLTRFREPLNQNIQIASQTIKEIISLFENAEDKHNQALIEKLKTKRTDVKRRLMLKMVPEVKKIILDSNIPARIDSFEQATAQQFEQLSNKRYIKESADYTKPTEKSEMDKIAPQSLVAFQMMPEFMDAFPSLKQGFTRHLQEVQNRIEEIPEIVDFSLQTCISYFEEKQDIEEAEKIGLNGMKRAENKIADVTQLLINHSEQESEKFKTEIEQLTKNLAEITDNENALQINLRITKARAVEKSRALRKKLIAYIEGLLPHIIQLFQKFATFLRESSIRIRKQFTQEDKKHFISTDISDYLTETEKAINRLPFIYQRLFKIEPLTSFDLYTKRKEAIDEIKTAYARWKDGKFAPAVIIAEKGWGKTTILNRFLKLKLTTEKVLTFIPDPDGTTGEFLEEIQSKTAIARKGDNADQSSKRLIVIIDGLEKLFEARVNGFECLLEILQYISDTNHHIFWLTTCHLYSWDYLEKTVSISDYFGCHVRLTDFTDKELAKTIERRHNISGYRLMFLPEAQKKTIISFKKQINFGDQEKLKEEFFLRMHKIVKGNLSQAFIFWMRSTAQVTEDSVYIEYLSSDYFNFLGSMSDSKLIILKNIIVHNGISYQKHARLFRIPPGKSRLLLGQLYDDGIVVKSGDIYNINPIIYRQVIDHMYLQNILH